MINFAWILEWFWTNLRRISGRFTTVYDWITDRFQPTFERILDGIWTTSNELQTGSRKIYNRLQNNLTFPVVFLQNFGQISTVIWRFSDRFQTAYGRIQNGLMRVLMYLRRTFDVFRTNFGRISYFQMTDVRHLLGGVFFSANVERVSIWIKIHTSWENFWLILVRF